MSGEPRIICGREAEWIFIEADKYDVRYENCGKYIFHNGLHEDQYKELSEEERERISNYVREYNESTNEWAELGDIEEVWLKIEAFNRNKK